MLIFISLLCNDDDISLWNGNGQMNTTANE